MFNNTYYMAIVKSVTMGENDLLIFFKNCVIFNLKLHANTSPPIYNMCAYYSYIGTSLSSSALTYLVFWHV